MLAERKSEPWMSLIQVEQNHRIQAHRKYRQNYRQNGNPSFYALIFLSPVLYKNSLLPIHHLDPLVGEKNECLSPGKKSTQCISSRNNDSEQPAPSASALSALTCGHYPRHWIGSMDTGTFFADQYRLPQNRRFSSIHCAKSYRQALRRLGSKYPRPGFARPIPPL
jgi:hypothetical protein